MNNNQFNKSMQTIKNYVDSTIETFVTNKIADSLILTSPNGSKFTITVSDDGQLSATPYGTNE